MTTSDQGYTYQPPRRIAYDLGILMAGGALLTVVLGVAVYLIAQTFAASPVVSALCVVLVVIMCALFSAAIIRQSREHATQLADVHKAVAAGAAAAITAALNQIIRQAQPQVAGPPYVPRAELPAPADVYDVRRSIIDNRPAGAGRVSAPGLVDGTVIECSTAGLTAALEILAAGGQPTRSAFRERGVMASTESTAAVDVLESLGYAERGAGPGSPARWADGVTPESAADIHAHLRTSVPTLPAPPEPVRNLPSGRAGGQAGRQAGSRKGRG